MRGLCISILLIVCSTAIYSQKLFTKLSAAESGVAFTNSVPETAAMNIILLPYHYNGGGVAVGDLNNDGLPDLYFVSNYERDKLFLNKGNLRFEDITEQSGIDQVRGWDTGVTMVDINNDGYLDIYVSRSNADGYPGSSRNRLYINNGDLTFTENSLNYGLDDSGNSTQAAFFDYDLDGDLDAFILNHNIKQMEDYDVAFNKYRNAYVGDKLYRNDNGIFRNVSEEAGIKGPEINYGLGVAISDLNSDGYPDIYVTNDFLEHDYMYINNGDGTFTDKLKESTYHISNFGMGVDVADMNNDALPDIMVVDMVAKDNYRQKTNMSGMDEEAFWKAVSDGQHFQYMINTLQLNNGNGTFSEISQLAGISNTDWSWAPLFADFDNDGWKDLIISNGLRKDIRNNDYVKWLVKYLDDLEKSQQPSNVEQEIRLALDRIPSQPISNYVYRNNRDLTFEDVTTEWGMDFPAFSTGLAYSDLDNDGDLDIVVNNVDGEAFLFKNNSTNDFIRLSFEGPPSNPLGIGAKVTILQGDQMQYYENSPSRGFQSAMTGTMVVGVGTNSIDEVMVEWPGGRSQKLTGIKKNSTIKLSYAESGMISIKEKELRTYLKDEEISGLGIKHHENDLNDFDEQVLLPHKLSTLGPALAIGDLDGDGSEDLFVGAAAGYESGVYLQKDGKFLEATISALSTDAPMEDTDALILDANKDGLNDLYIVSGGNFDLSNGAAYQDRLYLNKGDMNFEKAELPEIHSSGGVVVAEDFDGDGDEDLFVGGRVLTGRYPYSPSSYLLQNDKGVYTDITESVNGLSQVGMVTDAIWSDFDGDKDKDLIVVGEWMKPTVFVNNGGKLQRGSLKVASSLNGWWFSIKEADLNKDSRPDYLLGNLGLNYKYQASPDTPFEVFAEDFDSNSKSDIVLGFYDEGTLYPVRGRQCSSEQVPQVAEKFKDYESFGKASLEEIYGDMGLEEALHLKVETFASGALLSSGSGGYEFVSFPNEAQLSSINDFVFMDIDDDGVEEILAAGNLYESEVETPRNDASIGAVMRWTGNEFEVMSLSRSGFFAPGNVKTMDIISVGSTDYVVIGRNSGPISFLRKR